MSGGNNAAGTPNVVDYLLPKGRLYAGTLDANGRVTGVWTDLGNCPEFSLALTRETLKHFTSREGKRQLDREVSISDDFPIKFALEEFNLGNLALALAGTAAPTNTNPAVAGFAEINKAYTSVVLGRWYEVKTSGGSRALGILAASLTLEKDAVSDVALVLHTDYEVDEANGMFFLRSDAVNVAAGDDINVTLAADGTAKTIQTIEALTVNEVIRAIKWVSVNENDQTGGKGQEKELLFYKVSIKADGDLSLVGDDLTKMPFTGTAVRNVDAKSLTLRTVASSN